MNFFEAYAEMKRGKIVQYWFEGKANVVKLDSIIKPNQQRCPHFMWWSNFDSTWVPCDIGADLMEDTTWEICEQDPHDAWLNAVESELLNKDN